MKRSIKRSLTVGTVALSLCSTALMGAQVATVWTHGNTATVVKADQVAPSTDTIKIHKIMYDVKDANAINSSKIKNDGTEKKLTDQMLHYDPDTMGHVEFTLYDITDVVNKKFNDGKGLTGFTNSQGDQQAMQGRVDTISKSIQQSFNNAYDASHGVDPSKLTSEMGKNEFLSGATKVGTQSVGADGNVTFSNVKAYDASKPQKYHYYAAVETKTPRGFVVPPSEPIVFVNPYTNPNGDGFMSTVNLYPKNKTQKLKFNLSKYVLWNNETADSKKKLAGAKFQLYRGEPGKGQKVGGELTADSNGVVTASNLVVGKYYFVETSSSVANDDPTDQAKAAISPIAKNNADNKLAFEITENGIDPTLLQGSLTDYGKPPLDKHLTNGVGPHQSLHRGDFAHFQSHIGVPQNIMGSAWQIVAKGKEAKSEPYHSFFTRDEPLQHLRDVPEQRHLTITTQDGKKLQEGTDYQILNGQDNKWFVNYIVKGLSDTDKKAITDAQNSHNNEQIQKTLDGLKTGSVSDTVAAQTGKKLTYEYDEVLMGDTPTDKEIENDIFLDWNDGSGKQEIKDKDHTITYGVNFVKESSGFMGTGIAKQKLPDAQFVVQDLRTGKWFNGFKDNPNKKEKDIDWVNDYKDVKAGVLTSGKFSLEGFTEGDYKLREIKAPKGYQLMNETVNFHIGPDTDSHTLAAPIEIKNDEKTSMPFTGSQRLLIEIVSGVVVITLLGVGYHVYNRKKAAK